MMGANPYLLWSQIRGRETRLRLVLAAATAGLGYTLTGGREVWLWLAAVVVTQFVDAQLLRACARDAHSPPSTAWRAGYALSMFLTALVFSSIGLLVLRRGEAHAAVFAVLLNAGALLNLAMVSHRAPRTVVAAWVGHLCPLLALPWLIREAQPDLIGAACVTLAAVVFVGHLVIATGRSASADRETRMALLAAQEALARSAAAERRLHLAAEIADLHIYEMDFVAQTLSCDGAAATFLETPMTYAAMAADALYLVDPQDRPQVEAAWADYRAGRAPYRTEYRLQRTDGGEAWAFAAAELLRDERGRATHLVGVMRDLTAGKRDQRALVEARDRAEAGSRAKSAFLATMSHEIRTPLNGVLGMAQAMAMDHMTPVQQERLGVIRQSGEALLAILNDVLDLSKIEAGKLELEIVEFDLGDLTHGTYSTFTAIAQKKGLSFVMDVQAARGRYSGDPTRLRQILSNLISNALKFTEQGEIRVAATYVDGELFLSVQDTGPGIAAESLPRLFEKFDQLDSSTTRRFGGTGLGLAICRDLAELMGGRMSVKSEPRRGSRFELRLPLERLGDERADAPSPPPPQDQEAIELRVLAAEDNAVNQLVLKTLLGQVGVSPHVVEDGQAAVAAWETGSWDLILMDVQMPVMDGIAATARIRQRETATGRARTPIVALTANAMAHQVEEYFAAGMDGHLAKPIEIAALYATLNGVLSALAEGAEQPAA
ncbi:MAG: ATP-binding protein [Phenylobacterium sp.]|uniref:hybrid sensor histidine kinase/response regulator n=1 Tax=Phenylobacterium sp. TaxID=1871053 RepID=UPI002730E270|nr:PAS domain-containing hybrid sensor histidine kinase/response regulator [Phenylobacterium sp.]MDP2011830.1 ATP-binding protein [Phenylobacterium sp.]